MNINKLESNIFKCKNKIEFSNFLNFHYLEVALYLYNLDNNELDSIKDNLEQIFYFLIDNQLISAVDDKKFTNTFVIVLAEIFEELKLISIFIEIIEYLPKDIAITQRLKAIILYSRINDISEYHNKFDEIISLIDKSQNEEQFLYKSINAIIDFYLKAMCDFKRIQNKQLADNFIYLFQLNRDKYLILKSSPIVNMLSQVSMGNIEKPTLSNVKEQLNKNHLTLEIYAKKEQSVKAENSQYSEKVVSNL